MKLFNKIDSPFEIIEEFIGKEQYFLVVKELQGGGRLIHKLVTKLPVRAK